MSVQKIKHQGIEIYHFDYSQCQTQHELIEVVSQGAEIFRKLPRQNIYYSIVDFTNAFADPLFMEVSKKLNREVFDKMVKKGVILGISGVKKMLLDDYNLVAKNKLVPLSSRKEALDYLLKVHAMNTNRNIKLKSRLIDDF